MKRKPAFRKNSRNRISVILAAAVVAAVSVAVLFSGNHLSAKYDSYSKKEQLLTDEYNRQLQRQDELDEFRKYAQTKQYALELAKEKLNMVTDGEIVFRSK